jgi:pimeloyl-ACP methyl ester carboxylesterase
MTSDEPKPRHHADDLRGVSRLAVDATEGVTALVEAMHLAIASGPGMLGQPLAAPAKAMTDLVYGTIRGVTRAVGATLDAALAALRPLLGDSEAGAPRMAVQAALNGVLGDYLAETANPLAIEMTLQSGGRALPLEPAALERALAASAAPASTRLLVLIHGLAMHHGQWQRNGHDHGAALAGELGALPIYVHYNTGRHISTNGAELADQLERLVAAWPVPIDSITLIGHSMGGLVARSACEAARTAGHAWLGPLRALVSLGSPHHGAFLERGGNWLEAALGISAYSAPFRKLARIRSAGVTDLRYGNVVDAHWRGVDRFAFGGDRRTPVALPAGVACFAIAATVATQLSSRLPGDGLVGVDSALGRHKRAAHELAFPEAHRWIALGANHLDLLDAPAVHAKLRDWLVAI